MKLYRILFLIIAVAVPWADLSAAWADDLRITGTIGSTQSYDSNEGILFDNAKITESANVNAVSAFETRLLPGTHIAPGARFSARIKDDDGLDNQCEIKYFGNLDLVNEKNGDYDGDGLPNFQECILGTNPNQNSSDHDNDGLPDLWEIQYFGLDLSNDGNSDRDHDGVTNLAEYESGCMLPNQTDTDGDGLPDHVEDANANGAIDPGETNPCGLPPQSMCWAHPEDAADTFNPRGIGLKSPRTHI